MDMQHDQPTVPWNQGDTTPEETPTQRITPPPADASGKQRPAALSRRKLFMGIAGAGVAVAGGGVALAELAQHGALNSVPVLNTIFSHPASTGSNTATGHLLRRAGFGATPEEIASYSALGYNGAVDHLVNYQQVSDTTTDQRLNALNLDFSKIQNQQQWWLLRMAWTQRPLLEKMTLFWSGVLTSSYTKVGGPKAYTNIMAQNNFLRSHAFDTFDNILLGITSDPAMLFYLDLTKSRKNAPNENYARELMELFTLGLGHYTQQDVYEAAAALTGWHISGVTNSHYLPQDHNDSPKVYLGQKGNFDYKDVIRILTNHPAAPWFITRRLFTFFAYENPSDDDLKPLVNTYVESNHNMGEVMRTLLLSPQFQSQKAYRSRVKSPIEFVVGAYRALGISGNGAGLAAETTLMGQPVFNPPNVAGWPGDKVSAYWLNSGTWMARLNYVNALLLGGRNRTSISSGVDLQKMVNDYHIDSPESFVNHFTSFLLDGNLDQDRTANLVNYFKTADPTGSRGQITLTNGAKYSMSSARGTLYLIMSLPEYQLN